ncbi:MAG TPA: HAMP domain-containing sensor histidine kinase [Holophagaceae bacterium]|nr:HAMP domain-containing sensor histidine kinase [Holophagaceae bacterium]
MPARVLSTFNARAGRPRAAKPWTAWAGHGALALAAAATAVILWIGPRAWGVARRRQIMEAFNSSITSEPVQVGGALESLPSVDDAFPGDPAALRRLLQEHPLVVAAAPVDASRLLVREGWTLKEEPGSARSVRWLAWAREAQRFRAEGRYDPPVAAEEPPTFLLLGPKWTWVIQWRPGTPEAEAFLRAALGPRPRVRAGLARMGEESHQLSASELPPAFQPPNYQTTMEAPEARWTVEWTGTVLGPNWETIFQPWPDQARAWDHEVDARVWLARSIGLAVIALLALGLAARRNLHRREALEADRLAALTHSLKTPLAIHKLRCDSLRMGSLEPAKAAEELMKLGQEVDDLMRFIERGLLAREPGRGAEPPMIFHPAWLEDVAEGLREALVAEGRALELALAPQPGLAHLPSLRSGLLTLLENAYYYGRGAIRLGSEVRHDRLHIGVADEGPGLDAEALDAIGRPFQRLRAEGEEGFQHAGQGLGLSLLAQVAKQEGWGLELWSEPGQGFKASLEVPLGKMPS